MTRALLGFSALVCFAFVLLAGGVRSGWGHGAPSVPFEVSYAADVRPLLAEHCLECHGPDPRTRKARLSLDTAEGLARVVDRERPLESELWRRVNLDPGDDEHMPPASHGDGLDPSALEVLERWLLAGAPWESHWAYAPFRDVNVPAVADDDWPRNPIDHFVLASLESDGIAPSPAADRRTLLRRLSFDLIGMIPTPDEVNAFVADARSDAYERQVDRLLASPHYGEKWARHWLDLARYADSHGYTIDGGRTMWPYRDWVVDAINADLPYDRFTVEQIAGDLLPNATTEQRVATGFHRNTQINQEGGAKDEENRVNAVIDRVNTTGAVWLGETLACAQCHTHKFDPITHREYFQFFAFYDQTADGGVSTGPTVAVPDDSQRDNVARFEAEDERLHRELLAAESRARGDFDVWRPREFRASEGPELRLDEDGSLRSVAHNPQTSVYTLIGSGPTGMRHLRLEALPRLGGGGPGRTRHGNFVLSQLRVFIRPQGAPKADWVERSIVHAVSSHEQDNYRVDGVLRETPNTGWGIRPHYGVPHVAHFQLDEALPTAPHDVRVELHQSYGSNHVLGRFRIAWADGEVNEPPEVPSAWSSAWKAWQEHRKTRPSAPRTLVLEERATPRVTRIFRRGSFLDPGEVVTPGFPAALNHFDSDATPENRLDLARWLVHPQHALAHRVTVNRWWQRFFGSGLVETENDFGMRGARPSHPDLLEWLAREFVDQRFSMKALHRRIVMSATYRQASTVRADLRELDPANRRLARQSRLRADAEWIRDSALRASGLLTVAFGGPPVQPPQPDGVFAFTQTKKRWVAATGPNRYRRTLYTRVWRSSAYPFSITFDAPVPNVTCTQRVRSNTPLQALTLANDPMMIEIAQALAERLCSDAADSGDRLRRGFELCLSRSPTEREMSVLRQFIESHREHGAGDDGELRVWTDVARILFNLDEFITRE